MKTITESNENYSIIDLTLEYENWTGTERYAVIPDFDQEYLEQNYSSELSAFKPYLFMTSEFLDVRRNFRNNNKKFEMRELLYHAVYDYQDGITEGANLSLVADDFVDKLIESGELKRALTVLSQTEKERLLEYHIIGKTLSQIGEEQDCSAAAVKYSVDRAIKKLKKFYNLT